MLPPERMRRLQSTRLRARSTRMPSASCARCEPKTCRAHKQLIRTYHEQTISSCQAFELMSRYAPLRRTRQKRVKLFRIGPDQAVRILFAFARASDDAIMHLDGERLVTGPVRKRGLLAPLDMMKCSTRNFPASMTPCLYDQLGRQSQSRPELSRKPNSAKLIQ